MYMVSYVIQIIEKKTPSKIAVTFLIDCIYLSGSLVYIVNILSYNT